MANKELKKKEIKEKNVKNKKVKSKDSSKNFGKGLKSELKKVSWQSPSELFKSTLAVLVIIVIIGVIVFCLDIVFESMNKYGFDKIRDSIQSSGNETVSASDVEEIEGEDVEKLDETEDTSEDAVAIDEETEVE